MSTFCMGQAYQWHDPTRATFSVIHGRYWQTGLEKPFDRLPAQAKASVRPELWNLAQNAAGEYISFTSNATQIHVKYKVNKGYLPSNSTLMMMSGVDLYARDNHNKWY
ncbi:SGNH/GDSL hydrolase N-terminal domain-containing protein [Pedobacter psychrodurus]|uniref:SGNH/GDSL hydrolase N-terminal domain-containing protein n=1 Tax=Pedobacter psychrodurus TaxID=2530456 RepID=UPI0029302ABD|nr:SGNH/GDSL hydrolase N-terminal domain-containing protein [Pedobacter psychrodurus]